MEIRKFWENSGKIPRKFKKSFWGKITNLEFQVLGILLGVLVECLGILDGVSEF